MDMSVFFFNDTATTEIYTLSLHDALPISTTTGTADSTVTDVQKTIEEILEEPTRSEEHTSELQSQSNLVCRLLLEKKKKQNKLSHQNDPESPIVTSPVTRRCCNSHFVTTD